MNRPLTPQELDRMFTAQERTECRKYTAAGKCGLECPAFDGRSCGELRVEAAQPGSGEGEG